MRVALAAVSGVAVVGGIVGMFVAQQRREDRADAAIDARLVPVDEFVDTVLQAFDTRSYDDPFEPPPARGTAGMLDAQLAVGFEDRVRKDLLFHPEIVGRADPYGQVVSGRRFISGADTDGDGVATRSELEAAVRTRAGRDGMLDLSERRAILLDDGLGEVVADDSLQVITGWDRGSLTRTTAGTAAVAALRELGVEGEPAELQLRLVDVEPELPWSDPYRRALRDGPITSLRGPLGEIDEAGDGDGVVSVRELAAWIDARYGTDELLDGHVSIPAGESPIEHLTPQVIGSIELLDGVAYARAAKDLPDTDVQRWYDGSVEAHVAGVRDGARAIADLDWSDAAR